MKRDYFDPNEPNSYVNVPEDPFVLDFTGCKYLGEIHQVLKYGLGFPDYYGENWDALWDCIQGLREYPIVILVLGLDTLPKEFDGEIAIMLKVFQDTHRDYPHISFEIAP